MRYVEFECECGAMLCTGDPDFHEPKCHKCGLLGSWPGEPSFEDAIIQPDDPLPPRKNNLVGNFMRAMQNNLMPEEE